MDISVIIAIYGVERFIEKSLNSIFSQTKTDNVEFILVNDCTKDKSMIIAQSVIDKYPNLTVKIINHDKNRGVAIARQTGIDNATGTYTIHVDPDDWCELTMLEDLYNKAIEENADIVVCDFLITTKQKEFYFKSTVHDEHLKCVENSISLKEETGQALWNKLIKRCLYTDNNIEFVKSAITSEDSFIIIKLFYFANKIKYMPKAYLHVVRNMGSITSNFSKAKVNGLKESIKDLEGFLTKENLLEKFKTALLIRKASTKIIILENANRKQRKEYINLYPESDKYINELRINKIKKFAINQLLNGRGLIFDIIMVMAYPYKKIRKIYTSVK